MSPILFYMWIFNIPSSYLCLSKMLSSPVDDSGILVRNHVALLTWTTVLSFYCLAFYFVSLIFISASEPTSYCFYYFSSVICLEIWNGRPSNNIVLFFLFLGNNLTNEKFFCGPKWILELPPTRFCVKCWKFDWDCIESVIVIFLLHY